MEPEIFDLIKMLKSAEVNINYNEEHDCLNIQAGKFYQAKNVDHTLLPDRNVIVTHVCGALLKNMVIKSFGFTEAQLKLAPFTDILRQLNIEYEFLDDRMIVKGLFCKLKGKHLEIKAGHYPLFCSDWQPLIAVLSLLGLNMTIEDTLFESRFGYLEEYKKFDVKSRKINERRAEFQL